jgi:hypothetical protein
MNYNTYAYPYNNQSQNMGQYTFVNGYKGALEYVMPANSTLILMDNNEPVFYLKSTNAMGQATMKKYKFEEVVETPMPNSNNQYVTIEQFNALNEKLDALLKKE